MLNSFSFGRTFKLTWFTAAMLVAPHLSVAQVLLGLDQPETLPSAATQTYHEHKATLVRALSRPYIGNADVDYIDIVVALHEAIVSTAQAELKFGMDEVLKTIAKATIKESEAQIAQLKSLRDKVAAVDKTVLTKRALAPEVGGYAAKVRACVRPRVLYNIPTRKSANNPTVQYSLHLNRHGMVQDVQIIRSSGFDAFDKAVQKGIAACSPFPKPPSGKYPSRIDGDYRMYD